MPPRQQKKTLLLVFIHGFKGSDHTFEHFPSDLRALIAHTLPKIEVVSVQYPQYETRGDLKSCVARFREWLENKVIDLEVANRTPSPTVDPSVHVVLCGHSMGGIVAAETLLSIAHEEVVQPASDHGFNNTTSSNSSTTRPEDSHNRPTNLSAPDDAAKERSASTSPMPPPLDPTTLFFPRVKAIIAFDTPYLGISPGVLAHGAEEHINHASSAYKAFDSASSFFGWGSPRSTTPQPIPDAANRALPAAADSSGTAWNKWGKYAAFGGAAAALAGAAGAAYLSRNQISQGFAWAGSHFEFVSSLARGAELQKRVESVVQLTQTHNVGFADFYTALSAKANGPMTSSSSSSNTAERTFCVVPKSATTNNKPPSRLTTSSKSESPHRKTDERPSKSRKTTHQQSSSSSAAASGLDGEMSHAEEVQEFAQDGTKSKGHWVKCINEAVGDEIAAHTSMFSPKKNPGYHSMLPAARDEVVKWVDWEWYKGGVGSGEGVEEEMDKEGEGLGEGELEEEGSDLM